MIDITAINKRPLYKERLVQNTKFSQTICEAAAYLGGKDKY